MTDESYKEKFIAFLETMEIQEVENFIDLSIEDIKLVAKVIRRSILNKIYPFRF